MAQPLRPMAPTRCYTRDATKLLAQETPNKKVDFDKPNMWEPGWGGHCMSLHTLCWPDSVHQGVLPRHKRVRHLLLKPACFEQAARSSGTLEAQRCAKENSQQTRSTDPSKSKNSHTGTKPEGEPEKQKKQRRNGGNKQSAVGGP